MNAVKSSHQELEGRLAEAEAEIAAMRCGGVDAFAEDQAAMLVRLGKAELALHEARAELARNVQEHAEELASANDRLAQAVEQRRRAEEGLEASMEKYRRLEANIPGLVYRYALHPDGSFSFPYANSASRELFDVEPEDVMRNGALLADLIHPDDRERRDESIRASAETLQPWRQELRHVVNGDVRWYDCVSRPERQPNGDILWDGIILEITERKRAAQERLAHLCFLESMKRIDQAIRGTMDLDRMMSDVLDAVLSIFECDRAWLFYPCDPDAPSWQVPMERTVPEYPGALALGVDEPMRPGTAEQLRVVLTSDGPVKFGPGAERPVPPEETARFGQQSQLSMAIYPKVGSPWMFGLHQCSHPRVWTEEEERLLQGIGRRIGDALSSLLTLRDLRESEQRFRTVVEQGADAVFLSTMEGRVFDVNQRSCESLGYTREELLGMTLSEIDLEVESGRHRERIWEKLVPGRRITFEGLHRRKDGTTFPVEVNAVPLELEGQRVMLGLVRDISERKQAEDALRESEQRFRALVGQVADGILLHDLEGHIVEVNSRVCETLGYTHEELLGMTVADVDPTFVAGDHPKEHWTALPLRRVVSFETRHRRKDGSIFPVEVRLCLVEMHGRRLILASVRDISERKRAEEETERLEAQLRQSQKMEAVGQLAGGVAHDFNNLLTVILGNVELARRDLSSGSAPNTRLAEALRQIEQSGEWAAKLTRQLLTFGRRQVVQPQLLDLNDTLTGMEQMLRRLITEDITLDFARARELRCVLADASQIEQVVMNLVVNARDAMPDGGRLTLETSNVTLDGEYLASHPEMCSGEHVLLAVSDTGQGIDAATMPRIFEPFFTTKAVGEGTGMGLATAYGIVRQFGGHISVDSDPGHGTTFRVYLPVAEESTERTQVAAVEVSPPTGSETILLCEDEGPVRELSGRMLQSAGYTVLFARNAHHALELASAYTGSIHMLVTDVVMPGMHGKALADELTRRFGDLKVLFMSGYTSDVIAHHGVLDEGVEFLKKPFSCGALLQRVRQVLDRSQSGG
ncbi:MAG TPA: PAS domain S-box protein [Phycisphaerae bacterium]|nr:PAS domain S-box protein [Phycisphaerae bacterium]